MVTSWSEVIDAQIAVIIVTSHKDSPRWVLIRAAPYYPNSAGVAVGQFSNFAPSKGLTVVDERGVAQLP